MFDTNGAPQPVSWLEPASLRYKRTRAGIALGISLALLGLIVLAQVRAGRADITAIAWMLGIGALGAWVCYASLTMKTVRKFQTVELQLTRWQRLKLASPWLALGFGGVAASGGIYLLSEERDHLLAMFMFAPFAVAGVVLYALRRKQIVPTPEAAKMKAYYEVTPVITEPAMPSRWELKFEELVALRMVRYPAAAGLLWIAYEAAIVEKPKWLLVALLVFFGLAAAHELFLWLLFAGIVIGVLVLGFNLVAAIPVSIAVIIGALIIAGALKK